MRIASTFPLHRSRFRNSLWREMALCMGLGISLLAMPSASLAQGGASGRAEVFAGSVFESYLRYLQSLGMARSEPWSIRGFSPSEVEARAPLDSGHPWAKRYSFRRPSPASQPYLDYVRPTLGVVVNSGFPFGINDGPVWTGKGLTTTLQAGVAGEWGPLSIKLAPIWFRAENTAFALYPNTRTNASIFGQGQFDGFIDLPQRFGNSAYSRIDPGESTVQAEGIGLTAGVSTASQWWGPTDMFPYVLGNNAGGFPHVFFGTSKPADLKIVRLHTRVVYGTLAQSAYSPVTGSDNFVSLAQPGRRRFMAGIVGLAQFSRISGFEIGGSRFFHAPSEAGGFSAHDIGLPFLKLFRRSLGSVEGNENQLGSLFVRWSPPGSGFDVYGEYGREDFSADLRDYLLEPEHSATTNVGFRKAWGSPTAINALRAEAFSYESSAGVRTRFQGFVYIHGTLKQGHTYRGQMLGSGVGPGSGAAQVLAFDRFTPGGKLTAYFSRITQYENRNDYISGPPVARAVDVMNSLGTELTRFLGPLDVTAKLTLTRELNRNLRGDETNANLGLSVRPTF